MPKPIVLGQIARKHLKPSALVRQAASTESKDDGLVAIADQVRVYTLYKQQSVRDLRTKRSSTQPKKVLGGALDEFLLAYLEMGAG